jgi:hypothetical protein
MQVPEILTLEQEERLYIHQIMIQTFEQTSHCELSVVVPDPLIKCV